MKTYQNLGLTGLAALAFILTSCSNSGKGDAAPSSTSPQAQQDAPSSDADVAKQARIVITPKAQFVDLSGYIVGQAASSSLASIVDQSGKVGFLNVTPGTYDIVLAGKQVAADGTKLPVALRVSGIKVNASADTQVRDIELKPLIALEGRAVLNGAAAAGVEVSIPGTAYSTKTAADGSFSFPSLPQGTHNFEYAADGYAKGYIFAKDYRANAELPRISLAKDGTRLDSGVYYLGSAVESSTMNRVTIQLVPPAGMNGFRYSVNGDIQSQPWNVLQSSLDIEVPAGEHPEVVVQYSLDQAQFSPQFKAAIPTDY